MTRFPDDRSRSPHTWSIPETAKFLRLPESDVRAAAMRGEIPARINGASIHIDHDALLRLMRMPARPDGHGVNGQSDNDADR